MKLRDSEMELEAKEARLVEALKQRKKTGKKGQQLSEEATAALGHENYRLKEREQALMDAVSYFPFPCLCALVTVCYLRWRSCLRRTRT